MNELLVYYAIKYQGNYTYIKQAIERKEGASSQTIKQALQCIKSNHITILDENYPSALRYLEEPPFVLFYYGDLHLANAASIAMIGMRSPSPYGIHMASEIAGFLKENFVIVSGLALGIDSISHQNAKKTIAVLGCGIDYCYPKSHQALYNHIKNTGLLLSEYPNDTPPKRYYFPFRNRIIAALSKAVVVVEAKKKSGTMITVGYALALGIPVLCVPTCIGMADGCNQLISEGARIICSFSDIFDELNHGL